MRLGRGKKEIWEGGRSNLVFPLKLYLPKDCGITPEAVSSVCPGAFVMVERAEDSQVIFRQKGEKTTREMQKQAYELHVEKEFIVLDAASGEGGFYALVLLWQMYQGKEELRCGRMYDVPDLEERGFMLDISRGKVPKVETIMRLADLLARCRYNQLQLYIEGFSFCYPSFPQICRKEAALTPGEIREIDAYCAARFIELVPNQNSLGHMAPWLARGEFSHLAESEGGFSFGGFLLPSTTLDPGDPAALDFVEKLTDDLLPNFTSDKFHVGLDEPFELGHGKNSGRDLGEVFGGYVKKMNNMAKKHGRKMMMWSDALHRFDAISSDLPDDVIYLEWGYEKEYPFARRCARLSEAGKQFYVCPGTSSWTSFTGLTDNMKKNIDNALEAAGRYKARGILLTDWGDNCHMQYLPISYAAIFYCGIRSWSRETQVDEAWLADALDTFVFEDKNRRMGQIALKAGRYHLLEERQFPCATLAATIYAQGIKNMQAYRQTIMFMNKTMQILSPQEVALSYSAESEEMDLSCIQKTREYLLDLRQDLTKTALCCEDAELVKEEFENGIAMAEAFCAYRGAFAFGKDTKEAERKLEEAANRHRKLWLKRNKPGDLSTGIAKLLFFVEKED